MSTEFEARVCSSPNDVLSDKDQTTVREMLSEATAELISLENDESKTEDVPCHAEQYIKTQLRVTKLRAALSPQKNLPVEILTRIFVGTCECVTIPYYSNIGETLPWSLGRVCSRWRAISRAAPELWRRIHIDEQSKAKSRLLHDILENCGGKGRVDISLLVHYEKDWGMLLSLMAKYPLRLQGLSMVLSQLVIQLLSPLVAPPGSFDGLRSLSLAIRAQDLGHITLDVLFNSLFATCPHLRDVSLDLGGHTLILSDPSAKIVPWADLTTLRIERAFGPSVLDALVHCKQLLNLHVLFHTLDALPYPRTIILPQLLFIYVSGDSTDHITRLLSHLTLPSLETLSLHAFNTHYITRPEMARLSELFRRSTCRLKCFRSHMIQISPSDLVSMLRGIPELETWRAETFGPIPDSVLSDIVSEKLVPRLRVIYGWLIPSLSAAVEFLDARWTRCPGRYEYEGIVDAVFFIHPGNANWGFIDNTTRDMAEQGRTVRFGIRYGRY